MVFVLPWMGWGKWGTIKILWQRAIEDTSPRPAEVSPIATSDNNNAAAAAVDGKRGFSPILLIVLLETPSPGPYHLGLLYKKGGVPKSYPPCPLIFYPNHHH